MATRPPPAAVTRHPKWLVLILTTGEQRKIIPMAKAPIQAEEGDIDGGEVQWLGKFIYGSMGS